MKLKLLAVFLFLFVSAFNIGCKKGANADKVVTLKIAAKLDQVGPRPPATPDNPAVIYNMNVTEEGTNEKYGLNLGEIDGFTYVEGYEYVLKVKKVHLSNPAADGPIDSFKLIEVVSKTKVE